MPSEHWGTEKSTGSPAPGVHCFFALLPLLHYELPKSGETSPVPNLTVYEQTS